MVFNSVTFLCFLLIVVASSWLLNRTARLYLFFIASLIFYGFWKIEFIFLMLTSVCVDYFLAIKIHQAMNEAIKKRYLILSVSINLSFLFIFKYLLFFTTNLTGLLSLIGLEYGVSPILYNIILPLGISFYTFQTISYTVDVYRGFIKPEKEFALFATYVTFFPQLVAGPILRAKEVIPQLNEKRSLDIEDIRIGLRRIIFGLFLKVVLADNIAPLVDVGFSADVSLLSAFDVWTLAFLFGFQIYFDFGAYSHIALGCARLVGIKFPENFNFPYSSSSPRDFWKRWHISLSSWIRDYLYLPLTGSKVQDKSVGGITPVPSNSTNVALFTTWAIMGLWHGANWTFVMWGIYHALAIMIYRLVMPYVPQSISSNMILAILVTLPFMMLGWIPFRAENIQDALLLMSKVFVVSEYTWLGLRENSYITAAILTFGVLVTKKVDDYFRNLNNNEIILLMESLLMCLMIPLIYIFLRPITQFIYFQF